LCGNEDFEGRVTTQWGQLLLVLTVPFVVLLTWTNFAPVLPAIRDEFGLSNTWLGMLASCPVLVQVVLQLPAGGLIDAWGGKRVVSLGTLVMGIGVVGSGLAPSFSALLMARVVLGAGMAAGFVAGLAFARDFVPRERGVTVQRYYGAAASLGMVVAMLTSERLAQWGTWRGMFLVEGAAVVLIGCLQVVVLRSRAEDEGVTAMARSWRDTLLQPYLYLLGTIQAITQGSIAALMTWIVVFLLEQHNIGSELAGPLGALMPFVAIFARLSSGPVSGGRERMILVATGIMTALCTGLLPLMPSLQLVLLLAVLFGLTANVGFGTVYSYPSLLVPGGASGRDLSLVNLMGNLGGIVFPLLVGWGVDTTGSFAVGFALVAGISLVGSVLVALRLPHPRPLVLEEQ